MTDPGLNNRLRQRSRRAGFMVGITMALTIAICIGGFAGVYAGLAPYLSDLVPPEEREATRTPEPAPPAAQAVENDAPEPTAPSAPPSEPTPTPVPEPTATTTAFQPTHQIGAGESVNLRPEPSRNNNPIRALAPQTPLQFLDERSPAEIPDDAPGWMRFRTEQGEEGWVREIDTAPYQP
jgi:hypothetical protein